jgi:hypothetical protein
LSCGKLTLTVSSADEDGFLMFFKGDGTMLRATILRINGSVLLKDAEVLGQNPKRGNGDGLIWRGSFAVPHTYRRPTPGETLVLAWDNHRIAAVATEIDSSHVHFRAHGRAPKQSLL